MPVAEDELVMVLEAMGRFCAWGGRGGMCAMLLLMLTLLLRLICCYHCCCCCSYSPQDFSATRRGNV